MSWLLIQIQQWINWLNPYQSQECQKSSKVDTLRLHKCAHIHIHTYMHLHIYRCLRRVNVYFFIRLHSSFPKSYSYIDKFSRGTSSVITKDYHCADVRLYSEPGNIPEELIFLLRAANPLWMTHKMQQSILSWLLNVQTAGKAYLVLRSLMLKVGAAASTKVQTSQSVWEQRWRWRVLARKLCRTQLFLQSNLLLNWHTKPPWLMYGALKTLGELSWVYHLSYRVSNLHVFKLLEVKPCTRHQWRLVATGSFHPLPWENRIPSTSKQF